MSDTPYHPQINSDWEHVYNAADFEQEFNLTCKGAGLYMTPADTLIVTDVDIVSQKGEKLYRVHVYNCPFEQTIFANLPATKCDERDTREVVA